MTKNNKAKDFFDAALQLLQQNRFDEACKMLYKVAEIANRGFDWELLLNTVQKIKSHIKTTAFEFDFITARSMQRLGQFESMKSFTTTAKNDFTLEQTAVMGLLHCAALFQLRFYQKVHDRLQVVLPQLPDSFVGSAHRLMGNAKFELGLEYHNSFETALNNESGVELGLTHLDYGHCLSQAHRFEDAIVQWLKAIPYFQDDNTLLAWTRYNIGTSSLRRFSDSAETHLLEAVRLSKQKDVRNFESLALSGLAAFRRSKGEWSRAEYTYRQALALATNNEQFREAHNGIVRTLWLAKQFENAFEHCQIALVDQRTDHQALQIANAKILLSMHRTKEAEEILNSIERPVFEVHAVLYDIAKAELKRQQAQLDDALVILKTLPKESFHVREESVVFASLFALLQNTDSEPIQPLPYVVGLTVSIYAAGVLAVFVNNRPVHIAPTGRVGEILVFLLENNGEVTLDQLIDKFLAQEIKKPWHAKYIWKLIHELRDLLGWQNSVVNLGKSYRLDPNARWVYDMRDYQQSKVPVKGFLNGVYSNWVGELRESLNLDNGLIN